MQRKNWILVGFLVGLVAGLVITLALWRGPKTASASGQSMVVLCDGCEFAGSGLVFLDTNTDNVWIYSAAAMAGNAKPVLWGKLTLGQPVVRFKANQ